MAGNNDNTRHIAPPPPLPEQMLRELAALAVDQQPLCIQYQRLSATFELKSGLIQLLPRFHGVENEDRTNISKSFTLSAPVLFLKASQKSRSN